METNLKDFRRIKILVDEQKNIVIFPISRTKTPVPVADTGTMHFMFHVAFYPIELEYPYTITELAEKIKLGIELWNVHECYPDFSGRNTFEAKYYGIKGFKNAMKGKRMMQLGWNEREGKYISLFIPVKRGYGYMGLDRTKLSDTADWMDFAEQVKAYAEVDLPTLDSFKSFKQYLNL